MDTTTPTNVTVAVTVAEWLSNHLIQLSIGYVVFCSWVDWLVIDVDRLANTINIKEVTESIKHQQNVILWIKLILYVCYNSTDDSTEPIFLIYFFSALNFL